MQLSRNIALALSILVIAYAAPSLARNFQDEQAKRDLERSAQNTYEPPSQKDDAEPCRDEVASGYPSSVGSGSMSHRAINKSSTGCDQAKEKAKAAEDANTEAENSKVDVKVGLSDDTDPQQRFHGMEHPSRGGPVGTNE